ncbi:MAG: ABC transporter permease [Sphingobacteriaceae bacterium]|nr:ABC transporter permease [Cytophagaceae bacterium]
MNLLENFREGLRSIRANSLRAVLTALIIAIGITSLVGILTAIDGIKGSVESSFAGLGATTFDIEGPRQFRRRRAGQADKRYRAIEFREAMAYKQRYGQKAIISISTGITGIGQVKYASKKTNPNTSVRGGDENHLTIKGYKLAKGRDITPNDLLYSTNVAILGNELARTLFGTTEPIGKTVSALGQQIQIIGVLESKGNMTGGGDDRMMLLPLETGKRLAGPARTLTFDITSAVPKGSNMDEVVEEARGVMRLVRQDRLGMPDSFEIERADATLKELDNITGYLRYGGFGIGFITLLGASIALMNIMLVSVTERTREIGIRKSLGATPLRIRQQFLIEAVVICILGGIGGLLMGIGIGNLLSSVITQGAGFVVPWLWMVVGMLVCITVGILSGYYPAWRASKLDPIEALRYE